MNHRKSRESTTLTQNIIMTWNSGSLDIDFNKNMLEDSKNQRFFFQTYPIAGACKQVLGEDFSIPGKNSLQIFHTSNQFSFDGYVTNVAFMGDISKFTPMSDRRFQKIKVDKDFIRIDLTPIKYDTDKCKNVPITGGQTQDKCIKMEDDVIDIGFCVNEELVHRQVGIVFGTEHNQIVFNPTSKSIECGEKSDGCQILGLFLIEIFAKVIV